MKKFQFKTYQRNDPTVRALQFEPGMESDWCAFDENGAVLSTASREQDVRQAAPNAAVVAPIIDLPGLSGAPLTFGAYLVDIADGYLFIAVPAKDFEAAHTIKPVSKGAQ